MCVCRKGAPCASQGPLGIMQCSVKHDLANWGGAVASGAARDKAGRDMGGQDSSM